MISALPEQTARASEPPLPVDAADVPLLLRSVIDVTDRLQATHERLQARVEALKNELAAANEKLRRSRDLAALGEMAAGIAHEIRNPLAAILLDVELLGPDGEDPAARAAAIARVRGAASRLNTIVNDVLAFAREKTIRAAPIPVGKLLERAVESCAPLLRNSGITVNAPPVAPDWMIEADESLLVQAISNVLRNAIEAIVETTATERRITVRAESRRRYSPRTPAAGGVAITVEDNGPGIAPEVVRRMFNPFFTTRRAGTGLGLAIVHRIVDAHGGDIDVVTSPGRGTTISFCLPLTQESLHEPDTHR